MKLLSGNPDGFAFAFDFRAQQKGQQINPLLLQDLKETANLPDKKTNPALRAGFVKNLRPPQK